MDNSDSYPSSGTHAGADGSEADSAVKSATQEVASDARRRGQEVVSKAAHEAQQVVGHFREQAGGALGEGKAQLAAQIGGVARALKASSDQLRKDDLGSLADLSDGLAGQVEAVRHYLSDHSGETLLADLKTFARRRRGLFVGSLLAAGLLAVRFARSSSSSQGQAETTPVRSAPARSATVISRGKVRTYPRGRP